MLGGGGELGERKRTGLCVPHALSIDNKQFVLLTKRAAETIVEV